MTVVAGVAPEAPKAAPPITPIFPRHKMVETTFWLRVFTEDWHGEIPMRIHSRATALDGAPDWHPDFVNWIEMEDFEGNPRMNSLRVRDRRIRTTRAFRKLRKKAPREFDVLYSLVVHRLSLEELAASLTERAVRLEKPERYSPGAVLILTVSAIDKMIGWW